MDYPATLEFNAPMKVNRWRVVGNFILAIPHIVILSVVGSIDSLVSVFSWIAIVFTGRLPQGLADFQCMLIRYNTRVGTYISFLRNTYPPFDFDATATDNGGDPEVLISFRPELDGRKRASVFFRIILLIPVAVMTIVWTVVALFASVVGFISVLFLGRWPTGLRDFMVSYYRFSVRTTAYANLLTDQFPPLGLR